MDSLVWSEEARLMILGADHGMEDYRRILESVLLDDAYLLAHMGLNRADAFHFLQTYGAMPVEDRPALSPYFDPRFYVATNRDVLESGIDPFLHFVEYGIYERRSPHPLVNLGWLFQDRDVLVREVGSHRAFKTLLTENLADPNPYFDVGWYIETYPEARAEGALSHFLHSRHPAVRRPNRFFDPAWYARRYHDAPGESVQALIHFITVGDKEGRFPSPEFDPDWYMHTNTDVRSTGLPPLYHYLVAGRPEGRSPKDSSPATGGSLGTPARELEKRVELAPPTLALERYGAMRAAVDAARQRMISAFEEMKPKLDSSADVGEVIRSLALPSATAPKLSILIPCYNEVAFTVACLESLVGCDPKTAYEVVVADDASTDETVQLAAVPGLRYLRQPQNVGFLRNCNHAFAHLRGEYVLLLNNDTILTPGSLDAMVAVLDQRPEIGAVGPKICFPNGRLQEAGCCVNRDGTTQMVGLFGDPAMPAMNYRREVHYCSGAALLFRRSLIGDVLFDERFAPAYCEDLDLCLEIAARGARILYLPEAVLIHHLSVSTNRQVRAPKLQLVSRNQQKLVEKWGSALREMNKVRVIAFYLPQFHPIPQNDLWWGAGYTEWTAVSRCLPSYEGHYQPHLPADLGFYDLRLPDILEKQAALAARYGLAGFCVYYYNFGGRRILEKPLENLLAHPAISFPFCICWANENWTRRWDGGNQEVLLAETYDDATLASVAEDVVRCAKDERYIRIDGKPLILVYRPLSMPDPPAAAAFLRGAAAAAGIEALHLVYVESMEAVDRGIRPQDIGYDAAVEFPPHGLGERMADHPRVVKEGWQGIRYDYARAVLKAVTQSGRAYKRYPSVFPNWDNTPRQPLLGTSFDHVSPEAFQVYVEEKLDEAKSLFVRDERLLFVNAWNEWAEGAHLEPDHMFGHRWLEAIRNAMLARQCD